MLRGHSNFQVWFIPVYILYIRLLYIFTRVIRETIYSISVKSKNVKKFKKTLQLYIYICIIVDKQKKGVITALCRNDNNSMQFYRSLNWILYDSR